MPRDVMVVECIVLMDDLGLDWSLKLNSGWGEGLMMGFFLGQRESWGVYISKIRGWQPETARLTENANLDA